MPTTVDQKKQVPTTISFRKIISYPVLPKWWGCPMPTSEVWGGHGQGVEVVGRHALPLYVTLQKLHCTLQGLTIHDSVSLRILCPRRLHVRNDLNSNEICIRLRDAHAQKHHPVACPQMSASLGMSGISTILHRRCGWILIPVCTMYRMTAYDGQMSRYISSLGATM